MTHDAAEAGERLAARHGYVLAMRLMQSSLWERADDEERAAVAHFVGQAGDSGRPGEGNA